MAIVYNTETRPVYNTHAIREATPNDAAAVFEVVNAAYACERGCDGLAFKKTDRYTRQQDVLHDICAARTENSVYFVCVDATSESSAERILGCVYARCRRLVSACPKSESDFGPCVDFGPFAVAPNEQGKGIGSSLLNAVSAFALNHDCPRLRIEVVNHRKDLFCMDSEGKDLCSIVHERSSSSARSTGFYARKGFQLIGTAPCDSEHNCDESQITRPSHFLILEKQLARQSNLQKDIVLT